MVNIWMNILIAWMSHGEYVHGNGRFSLVIAHVCMSHSEHINESWHTYGWITSHIWSEHINESWHTYGTHMDESRHTCHGTHESWHTYGTHMDESRHTLMSHGTHMKWTYQRVMAHIWHTYGWITSHMSWHTWVMAHIWHTYGTHMDESRHKLMSHGTHMKWTY